MIFNCVEFKSLSKYYDKEKNDKKNNTIRKIDKTDGRFSFKPKYIIIRNKNTNESFIREISDITDFEGYRIFTWKRINFNEVSK